MDWQDIVSGIDYLVEQGIADPDRLAIAGGSYGGYMTMWIATQTKRFKAAVSHAGLVCSSEPAPVSSRSKTNNS